MVITGQVRRDLIGPCVDAVPTALSYVSLIQKCTIDFLSWFRAPENLQEQQDRTTVVYSVEHASHTGCPWSVSTHARIQASNFLA